MKTSPTLFSAFTIFWYSLFLLSTVDASAQTNVRAWYAQGQVWIVWQMALPFPETVAVYKKNSPFNNTTQATIIGRLFQYEYLPGTYVEQTLDPTFTYTIPKPDGSTYTLAPGEGLFVETVTGTGSAFYAVVEWGNTAVNTGVNITQNAVAYTYDPLNQPVNCHLQLTQTLPTGHKTKWYSMWAFGRPEHWAGRPDFPVMANAFKNGMPSMFIVSEALAMDTTGGKKIPVTHWFHGGGMVASQFLANDFRVFNCEPQQGISVSHNDDFGVKTVTEEGDTAFTAGRSLWFGWSKAHNPFNPGFDAGPGDTIINYTQRRVLWINNWLIKNYNTDPKRIALQGYSMGSAGASALGKAFPNQFSTVCALNNGYRAAIDIASQHIMGSIDENLPTNLRRSPNDVVRMNEIFDLTTRISPFRDLPLFRTWAGKNDPNDRMHWGADLVAQYRLADSLGLGTQISWDERAHTYETLGRHWIQDLPANLQTYRDNLAYQEFFRRDQSYPAFFNHRLDAQNNDPGIGIFGINNGDGDNWGTWGGWHNWEPNSIVDLPAEWGVTAWLTATASFANDICPFNSLTADVAIRKPQQFTNQPGTPFHYEVIDVVSGSILQEGVTLAQPNGLVVIPQVTVYREDIRRVRISVTVGSGVSEPGISPEMKIVPNPSSAEAVLSVFSAKNVAAKLCARSLDGKQMVVDVPFFEGENRITLSAFSNLPPGFYLISFVGDGCQQAVKWVKM